MGEGEGKMIQHYLPEFTAGERLKHQLKMTHKHVKENSSERWEFKDELRICQTKMDTDVGS